jgi:hypothetical protein
LPRPLTGSEAEAADTALVPADVVGQLMAQSALDLAGEQLSIVAKVALQGVAVDDDPVLVPIVDDTIAEVLAVSAMLGAKIGDDHGDVFEQLPQLRRQGVDRVGNQPFELPHSIVVGHRGNGRVIRSENPPPGELDERRTVR